MKCANSAFCLTMFSQDGGGKYKGKHQVLTSTATITINVIDAQDMPPSFIGTPYFGYVYEVSVPVSPRLILYTPVNVCLYAVNIYKIDYVYFSSRVLKYSLCTLKMEIKAILTKYIIPSWMVRTS